MAKPTSNVQWTTRIWRWLQATFELLMSGVMGRWRRFEIADHSMRPALGDGDWTVGIVRPRRVSVGDVVICDLPTRPGFEIVKRITAIDPGDGALFLLGDNPSAGSVDSRSFGPIPAAAITARLAMRYRPLPPRLIRRAGSP